MMVCAVSFAATAPTTGLAQAAPATHVLKDPNRGGCTALIEILREDGVTVTPERGCGSLLFRHKRGSGIPQKMTFCHSGEIEGGMIEGHVPTVDTRRLLAERPDAVGPAVPGMPCGSSGMGAGDERETCDVVPIRSDGGTEVFSSYEAARKQDRRRQSPCLFGTAPQPRRSRRCRVADIGAHNRSAR